MQILKSTCSKEKQCYHQLLNSIKALSTELKELLSTKDFEDVCKITDSTRENAFIYQRSRLKEKFEQLRGLTASKQVHNSNATTEPLVKSAILNLTASEITGDKKALLELGPKFVPAIEKVPIMEIVTSAEIAASKLERIGKPVEAERMRHDLSNILLKHITTKLPSNLSKDTKLALKELKCDEDIKVVQFDKGTGFVLLEKADMIAKIQEQIGEARVLKKDPTKSLVTKFQNHISKLRKCKKINDKTFYQIYPSDAVPPRLYGCVKAHKPEKAYPMRTIVSTIGTAFYGTSKYLVDIIQPTLDRNEIRVKNSASFIDEAKTWNIDPDEIQVSYDVVALYPSVPIKKAIVAMVDLLTSDLTSVKERTMLEIEDIRELLTLCLSKCYFFWEGNYYEIPDAGPIGLSLMVVIAEGYLQVLEKQAIDNALSHGCCPKTYRRYVDDSHARFNSSEEAETFRTILNQQDESIQYTVESQDSSSQLSFLDITVMNNGVGNYDFKVFRKEAITNVMQKPSSSVNPELVNGIFKGFVTRAIRICSPEFLQSEIDFLINVFTENGHDGDQLKSIATTMTTATEVPTTSDDSTTPQVPAAEAPTDPVMRLPWIPRISPRIRKMLRKHGVKTVFTSGRSLSDLLCNHKSKLPKNSYPGVYQLKCQCNAYYIGETKKRVRTRITEHEKNVFNGEWKQSGATEHAKNCPSQFEWDDASTLAIEPNYRRRKIRESLEIRRAQRSQRLVVNRDQGTMIQTDAWDVLMGKIDVNYLNSNE